MRRGSRGMELSLDAGMVVARSRRANTSACRARREVATREENFLCLVPECFRDGVAVGIAQAVRDLSRAQGQLAQRSRAEKLVGEQRRFARAAGFELLQQLYLRAGDRLKL